jgi:endonuclease/exonuclease/phosphatase (EEP) superfamily protein YafD
VPAAGLRVTSISWAVAGGLAAWTVARVAAADRVRRTEAAVVPLLAFTPQVAKAAPWAALALALAGRRRAAATAGAAAAALGLLVWTRQVRRGERGACGRTLRVLTSNLYFGRADAEFVVARVRHLRADVLFLQELTADAVTRMKRAGLDELLPYSQLDLRGGSSGSGIYSRYPLREGPVIGATNMAQPTAQVELPGGEAAELICVHPAPPNLARRGGAARWRQELGVLTPPGDRPRVLAGDFNATLDHAAFRAVLRLGYQDAGLRLGQALTPTWGRPGRRPVLTLDHVLVTGDCDVLEFSVHVIPGSDHRAVFAEVQLPAR